MDVELKKKKQKIRQHVQFELVYMTLNILAMLL